jgi:DNA-directed RNA polymerase specialized sigma24 family protein
MNTNENLQPGSGTHARFPSQTQWTALIGPAADPSSPQAQETLNHLCQVYWFPLYAFVRSQRIERADAKDLVQGFFLKLLKGNLLQQARREKGRFRTFLLACLRHYMNDEWDKGNALRRGGGAAVFSIDDADAEAKYQQLPSVPPPAEAVFDRTWAATVIEQASRRLEEEYVEEEKRDRYEAMQGCLTGQLLPASYPELSAKLGMTVETFQTNLVRFKSRFRDLVRHAIAATVDASEIDEEIRYLMAAWSAELEEQP